MTYDPDDVAMLLDAAAVIAGDFRRMARRQAEEGFPGAAAYSMEVAAAAARITAARHRGRTLGLEYEAFAAECDAAAKVYDMQARAWRTGWDAVDTASD